MARWQLRGRRVGGAVVQSPMDVSGAGLGHPGGGDMIITFIDGRLHLLQELIDVDQVALRPRIPHGWEMITRRGQRAGAVSASDGDCGGHGLIFRDGARGEWKVQAMKADQTLSHRTIGSRIELTSFEVAKQLVQGLVAAFLRLERSRVTLVAVVQGVIHISV